jgi:hypothetical protein
MTFSPSKNEEEKMKTGFHGIDRHRKYSNIAILNCKGEEIDSGNDLKGSNQVLGTGMRLNSSLRSKG